MTYTEAQCEELRILSLFDLSAPLEGIKVHTSAANSDIEATKRLFEKGLVTQVDGGYLTPTGQKAAEHAQLLHMMLS